MTCRHVSRLPLPSGYPDGQGSTCLDCGSVVLATGEECPALLPAAAARAALEDATRRANGRGVSAKTAARALQPSLF